MSITNNVFFFNILIQTKISITEKVFLNLQSSSNFFFYIPLIFLEERIFKLLSLKSYKNNEYIFFLI